MALVKISQPESRQPVIDAAGLFSRFWLVLFAGWFTAIGTLASLLEVAQAAITALQAAVTALQARMTAAETAIADLESRGVGETTVLLDLTLAVATTRIDPPDPTQATRFIVVLRQDGTGGRAVTWGVGFVADSTGMDTTALKISTFQFAYSDGMNQWVQIGQPSTGMSV